MKALLFILIACVAVTAQDKQPETTIQITKAAGNVYFLEGVGDFGGGNVAASVGPDGILLVDDMYARMADKIRAALKTVADKPVRIVLNTHFHGDHIQGNKEFRATAVIIAHENVSKRIAAANKDGNPTLDMLPHVTFSDRIVLDFNGEEIQMVHFPDSHTDSDSVVYFTKSKVLHLGDLFFNGMFPAVYTQGGGDIRQLVRTVDKIIADFPADARVIPGHGELGTMDDLKKYDAMLKETISIVESGIKQGKTLEQMKAENVLAKYDSLGSGGAQTTEQYLTMLFNLLSAKAN